MSCNETQATNIGNLRGNLINVSHATLNRLALECDHRNDHQYNECQLLVINILYTANIDTGVMPIVIASNNFITLVYCFSLFAVKGYELQSINP